MTVTGGGWLYWRNMDDPWAPPQWPGDDDGWIPLGVAEAGSGWSLSYAADGTGLLDEWSSLSMSTTSRTATFSWPLSAMSWRMFRLLFGRAHPGARRAHRAYVRRLRARRRARRSGQRNH